MRRKWEPSKGRRQLAIWTWIGLLRTIAPSQVAIMILVSAATRWLVLHQLANTGEDLAAVQLDVCHKGLVRQSAGAVLQVEPRGT
jgi:hypothetical protein